MVLELNELLRKEADTFLIDKGLLELLAKYGEVYISGSYALDLMVWRDLDLFVDMSEVTQNDVYDLSSKIFEHFQPVWFETKNTIEEESGCPKGFFVGFETKVNTDLWNFDIWFTNREHIRENKNYIDQIKSRIRKDTRKVIIDLKRKVYRQPQYGTEFFSVDVYESVMNGQVRTLAEFKSWIKTNREIVLNIE